MCVEPEGGVAFAVRMGYFPVHTLLFRVLHTVPWYHLPELPLMDRIRGNPCFCGDFQTLSDNDAN